MEERTNYVKHTQRDYTLILKLNIAKEIESENCPYPKLKKVWHPGR